MTAAIVVWNPTFKDSAQSVFVTMINHEAFYLLRRRQCDNHFCSIFNFVVHFCVASAAAASGSLCGAF